MPTANLARSLRFHRIRRGAAEALVDGAARWTYDDLDAAVDRHAHALVAAGAEPGEIVAILGRNSATYLIEILAVARIGCVLLPLNWRLHPRELTYILEHSGATLLLVDEDMHEKAASVASVGRLRGIVTHGNAGQPGWHVLDTLLAAAPSARYPDAEVGLDDVQRILYTSGTTSHPKGVVNTNGNVLVNQVGQVLELELTAADRTLLSAPLFHVAGIDAPGQATLFAGGTVVVTRSFAGRDIVELAARERVTGMVLAAQILFDILALPDRDSFDLSAWRFCIFGGVPPADRLRFKAAFPDVRTIDTFGMTEITNGACYMDAAHEISKIGSQGTPFPLVDLRVVGPDDEPLPPGQVGEIVVRGPKVTPGYWKEPEITAQAWRGGWFHTGDMASIDEDGYLWFADRKNDMIRSGGENVASAEIERILAMHPDVAEVAVIGVPDPRWDEVPKAFVIARAGATVTPAELVQHCADHLAKFKVPGIVEIVDYLPRNDSGKVLKRVLRDDSLAGASSLDARGEQRR